MAALSAYGQSGAGSGDFQKIQVGVNFSPDFCFLKLKNNDGSAFSDSIIQARNADETMKIGLTMGANACYNFNKLVGIEAGIHYSNKGYQTVLRELFFGMPGSSAPVKSKSVYNIQYIDIPVKANFTFGTKPMRFFSSIGIITNLFFKETITTVTVSDKTERKTSPTNYNYKKVNLSPTLSAGMAYQINNKMSLRAEAAFRYGIMKIVDAPVTGYLSNTGLNFGFYFGL